MKIRVLPLLLVSAASCLVSCNNNTTTSAENKSVVVERYVHKYGYAVSKEEWNSKNYPGQVIKTLDNGVTVTSSFEDGQLHGPSTYTFPDSQTVEILNTYSRGTLVKEMRYDMKGLPIQEIVHLSPKRTSTTVWYEEGMPRSIEETVAGTELVEGQYFTKAHELESRVERGRGVRTIRDNSGLLLAKEAIEGGFITEKTTFYPNGNPEMIAHFASGVLHGTKKTFSSSGEPKAIEEWSYGQLNGPSVYFKNGCKHLEISYKQGVKDGEEIHYIDGKTLSQKVSWAKDRRHGPSTHYVDGQAHTKWYYEGMLVSHDRFDELCVAERVYMPRTEDTSSEETI